MGKSQQRKGREAERELARVLREYGFDAEAGAPVSFGRTPDVVGLDGIHIECKRVERLNVNEALRQAIEDSERFQDGVPALFHRRSREPWLVTMRLDDFKDFYKSWEAMQNCGEE